MYVVALLVVLGAFAPDEPHAAAERHPLPAAERERMRERFERVVAETTQRIAREPERVELYSRRGDARFFLGRFDEAVADYDRMLELDPRLETSHWRRGIALFYAGEHRKAARQFEVYHTFDNVDRENGIWRFLSQLRADGLAKARAGLLKYEKDDREPFPAVYRLFAGQTTPDEILDSIERAEIGAAERDKRMFYARLYVGLNHAVEDQAAEALEHLRAAVANPWGRHPGSGYGPHFMWHVGRLHYERLARQAAEHDADRP